MKKNKESVVILIDGHSLAYRSYFALERTGMRNKNNLPTWAVYGFLKAFFDLIAKVNPEAIAVSFDVSRTTFRTEKYPEYKANRPSMPDEMKQQMSYIRKCVETLDIPIYEKEGFEADDIIGTLSEKITAQGHKVVILTGDQDSFQLLDNDKVTVLLPIKGTLETFNREKVKTKLGVYPEQVVDYKGLCGDSSDNIPGVKGIGEKSAVTLLNEYKDIEDVYNNIENINSKRIKNLLENGQEIAYLSKDLATIRRNINIAFDYHNCQLDMPHLEEFIELLKELEFRSLLRQLPTLFENFNDFKNYDINISGDSVSIIKKENLTLSLFDNVDNTTKNEEIKTKQENISIDESTGQTKLEFENNNNHSNFIEKIEVIDNQEKFQNLINTINKVKIISVDLETDSLKPLEAKIVGISIAWQDKPLLIEDNNKLKSINEPFYCKSCYIPVGHENGIQLQLQDIINDIKNIFEDKTIKKIFHNAKYDMHVLLNHNIKLNGLILDTMIASYIEDPAERHGLKELAMSNLHFIMRDFTDLVGKGKKMVTINQINIEEVAEYACHDAAVTLKLAHYFTSKFDETQNKLLYNMEIPLITVLLDMERTGIKVDTEFLKNLSKELSLKIKEIEESIYEEAKYPEKFNINSPKQLGEVLFEHMKIPSGAKNKTKTGYSTSANVLENLANEYKIAKLLLEYRHLTKLQNTYIESLPALINKQTGKIHTSYNQATTTTGRLSSSDPNLQNIPIRTEIGNSIRKAFIPTNSNHYLLSADYSQIELRIMADLSEEPNLLSAFKEGKDIHSDTACKIFSVSLDNVTKDQRRVAKAVNFGILYGQTAYGLSETINISPKEAKEFINRYFETYPKVKLFMDKTIKEAHIKGYVTTKLGRNRYFINDLQSKNKNIREFAERAAINAPLQGTASDIIKIAMINMDKVLTEKNLQSKILLQVHDELVFEVPEIELEETKLIVKDVMENAYTLKVPLIADLSVGHNWMEAK